MIPSFEVKYLKRFVVERFNRTFLTRAQNDTVFYRQFLFENSPTF